MTPHFNYYDKDSQGKSLYSVAPHFGTFSEFSKSNSNNYKCLQKPIATQLLKISMAYLRVFAPSDSRTRSAFTYGLTLGQVPSLHHLRQSMASQFLVAGPLFDGFPGTMNLSDCSTAYMLGLRHWPSPAGLAAKLTASRSRALPVPVHGASAHATGL